MSADDDPSTSRLYQLAYQPTAIVKLTELPRIFGLTEADAAIVLADLVDAGDIDLWPEKGAMVLSSTASDRLDLEMVADRRGRLVWYDRDSPSAERAKQAATRTVKRPKMELEADLRDDEGAYGLDDLAGPTSVEMQDSPSPLQVMGIGLIWHGPSTHPKHGARCKGCGHCKKMPASAYCALCERSGNRRLRAVLPEGSKPAVCASGKAKQGENREKAPLRSAPLAGGVEARPKGRKQGKKVAMKIA